MLNNSNRSIFVFNTLSEAKYDSLICCCTRYVWGALIGIHIAHSRLHNPPTISTRKCVPVCFFVVVVVCLLLVARTGNVYLRIQQWIFRLCQSFVFSICVFELRTYARRRVCNNKQQTLQRASNMSVFCLSLKGLQDI